MQYTLFKTTIFNSQDRNYQITTQIKSIKSIKNYKIQQILSM